ncbi:hypothetical protein JIN85_17575 [Luteolibacter pohnpeiensis]|uniref:Uncharacterized protein n=1 Tax=Luteolibacter pohnpeiensis TaxID=454153 RepID=A0A934SAE5_9BACT|nr:hypothetical protein [Luteolibacter pohnpeiensis]MBK1884234.1 hypothetical protein [Luteolibacter pohnpeiensis]
MIIVVVFFTVLALFLGIACCATSKRGRIIGAIVAFGWACLMFMAANMAESFNLNIWYSSAADDLLESSIEALDAGQVFQVSAEFSAMREDLEVTYEHRGNFKELALATAKRIRSSIPPSDAPKVKTEQGTAPQSATRSESDTEGSDTPEPESEPRSR